MRMMQNVYLLWLDSNIDQDNNDDCRNTIAQLRRVVNTINTFTDRNECIDFLTDNYNEKGVMIISGTLCRNIVPLIHDVAQLDTVLIFCKNKTRHEQWAKEWAKIKGIFTEISSICQCLKQVVHQCEQNIIPISFVNTSDDVSNQKLDQLDSTFMYTQILKEILLSIKFEQKHIQEFIDYCRRQFAGNESTLVNIKELETKYLDKTPIWWYTYECFLYSTLNRALRTMEVDMIMKMGFFLSDLHRNIERLHSEQFSGPYTGTTFTVYRGQGISREAFEQMSKTKGGLMSFNNFLSTSKDRDVSFAFASSNQNNPDLVGILFVITIDPSKSTTPFACISGISYFQDEDEVLFSMHTVFRIRNIKPMDENLRIFQVDLTLTIDTDKDLCLLTDCLREEIPPNAEEWERLGILLFRLNQSDKALKLYQVLLEETTKESRRGPIYHQLGWAKQIQGDYEEAINFYKKAVEIQQQSLRPNHRDLASSYNGIGAVYFITGKYSKALSFYEKSLTIGQKSLPGNHPYLSMFYGNIGNVYQRMGKYSEALSFYEKTLIVRQQSLPPNHPDLASSYSSIGNAYHEMGEYLKAFSSYEKALAIRQQSLPPNHIDLASSYNNIGEVYQSMGEYSKALSSHEKGFAIRQQSLPPNHLEFAMSYCNIGNANQQMGEYSKALSSYEKALAIQQQSLPPNHPDLASSYNNIGTVCENIGEYSRALSSYEKALEIQQQSLPSNHPDLACSYNNVGMVYARMDEHSRALLSHEKALAIQQRSLPSNHPYLASSYNNIGTVYDSMGEYSKARSFYERAVNIGQHSLPSTHPDLQGYRKNLDRIKMKL